MSEPTPDPDAPLNPNAPDVNLDVPVPSSPAEDGEDGEDVDDRDEGDDDGTGDVPEAPD